MKFSDCFKQYNDKIKNQDPSIPYYKKKTVSIDAVSLKYDFCSGSNVPNWRFWVRKCNNGYCYWTTEPINKRWLGELTSLNNGTCKHIQ